MHISLIERFLAEQLLPLLSSPPTSPPQAFQINGYTVKSLLDDEKINLVLLHGFGLVKETATLADAKAAMDSCSGKLGTDNCYDVFVTANADQEEPVLGWITNDIIRQNASV